MIIVPHFFVYSFKYKRGGEGHGVSKNDIFCQEIANLYNCCPFPRYNLGARISPAFREPCVGFVSHVSAGHG